MSKVMQKTSSCRACVYLLMWPLQQMMQREVHEFGALDTATDLRVDLYPRLA